MDQAELVEQFSGLTSTSSTEALNWLEMAGFELQAALDLFFNAAGGEEVVTQPAHRKETHEERFDYDEDEVRMPDEVKRQKLVDTDVYLENQVSRKITSAFTSGSKKAMSEKDKTLSVLFQAPTDIMTQTSFDEAKELAKAENKWLLVNIQRDSEFQSHALNRDFWSDEAVKDMVLCSFVFWQKLDITPDGETYVRYYKITSFPHIAIIDPRTGGCQWQWQYKLPATGNIVPKLLAEKIQDFLGDNPSPAECRPKQLSIFPGSQSAASSSRLAAGQALSAASRNLSGVTSASSGGVEADEDLERAIQMSLQDQQPQSQQQQSSGDASTAASSVFALGGAASTVPTSAPAPAPAPAAPSSSALPGFVASEVLNSDASTVPSGGTGAAAAEDDVPLRAQIRLPNGAKGLEKLSTGAPAYAVVLAVARLLSPADADKRFEVDFSFPRRSLSEVLAATAKEQGLAPREVTLGALGIAADTVFHVRML